MEKTKMKKSERAKQFMPFSALKGLNEKIKEVENNRLKTTKIIISKDKEKEIINTINELKKENIYKITYFVNGFYKDITTRIKFIKETKQIKVLDNIYINLNDIYDIILIDGLA